LKEGRQPVTERSPNRGWTFITSHAQVLLALAQRPDARVREIAETAGITERYAYRVLYDLQQAGYVERRRRGRCNLYRVNADLALRDAMVEDLSVRTLLSLMRAPDDRDLVAALAPARRSA
jgi:DNA-binding IclR family transcriptional regulator